MKFARLFLLLAACFVSLPALADTINLVGTACEETQCGIYLAQITPGADTTLTPPVSAAPVTQNTVTTTGPVKSETTISVGTLAGSILNWIMVAFGPVIGSIVVWILVRVLKKLGIDATDALRERLQEIVVNGLNAGAQSATESLQGKDQITIKNAVVQQAIAYTQVHGEETIKALGLDPQSGKTVEAIKARIETAINDPTMPTPPILDGAGKSTSQINAKAVL
jgi:hypothetical protein